MTRAYRRARADFLVNEATANGQSDVAITALADGGFVMSWTDASLTGGDASGNSVKARFYNASGVATGGEFLVNTSTAGNQDRVTLAARAGGGFTAFWTDASGTGGDTSFTAIRGQSFAADGSRIGGEFLVNTTTFGSQQSPAVAVLTSGATVVTWADSSGQGADRSGSSVRAQLLDASGARIGGEFVVNTITTGSQEAPAVAALAGGGFVVTWADNSRIGGDSSGFAIKAQRYDASGARLGGEFLVNTATDNNQSQPTIAALASGRFVVVWTDMSGVGDPSGSGIKAQLFGADGSRIGGEVLVNGVTVNTQNQPAVVALPGGGFAVSWADNSVLASDYSSYGIKTQIFDDDAGKIGTEFVTNTATQGSQDMPALVALASGDLIVGWTDASATGADTSSTAIRAAQLTPGSGAITEIGITATQFSEASAQNTAIAALSANGSLNAAYHYELTLDSTDGAFRIENNRIYVADSLKLDFETDPAPVIGVRATDNFGNSFEQLIPITITNALRESRYAASDEVLVNTATANNQQGAEVARLADGGFVVTWEDGSQTGADTSGYGIKAQLFNADGSRRGGEFLVNTVTAGNQSNPEVEALAGGGFVVTWSDASGTRGGTGTATVARTFDAAGNATSAEITVAAQTGAYSQADPSVAAIAGGGFVVSFTDSSGRYDSSGSGVVAQRFDASGTALGGLQLVNSITTGRQDDAAIAGLASGGYVVTWRDASLMGGDALGTSIKARVFGGNGQPIGEEFLVNTSTKSVQLQPTVTELLGGNFVTAWTDNSGVGDTDYYGIKAQIFTPDGAKVGGELQVNTSTANAQQNPSITTLASGGFVISWLDFSGTFGEDGGSGVRSQSFTADGQPLGAEVAVNYQTLGSQADPSVAMLASGAFVVAYTDASGLGGDPDLNGIKLRIFTPITDPTAPVLLRAVTDNVTATEDQQARFAAADLLANDVNGNGGILSITGVTAVSGGSVSLAPDDSIVFTPNPDFDGRAIFEYQLEDGTGARATGRVFVQVAGVNDAPTAVDDALTAGDTADTVYLPQALTANDIDPDSGDVLRVTAVSALSAAGVAVSIDSGNIVYRAGDRYLSLALGEVATDSFTYIVTDSGGLSSIATASVRIVGTNQAPDTPVLDRAVVPENAAPGTLVGTVTARDIDHGDIVGYTLLDSAGGRFAIDAVTGALTATGAPNLDFETATSHRIVVRAFDLAGATADASLVISVLNLPEPRFYNGDNGANVFVAATADLWTINGNGGNDTLTGNIYSDTLSGGAGNDSLDGGAGADLLIGGIGADSYVVDNPGDVIVELPGEGIDQVFASTTYTLADNIENMTLVGTGNIGGTGNGFDNTINGNIGNNLIDGGAGRDFLLGNAGNDTLIGGLGRDSLQGGDGDDMLIGGAGFDDLVGGAGRDWFVFDAPVTADADVVRDFRVGEDKVALSLAGFAGLGSQPGALDPALFAIGGQFTNAGQRLLYNPVSTVLVYDPDGNGAAPAIQIANFNGAPVLSASDFVLI